MQAIGLWREPVHEVGLATAAKLLTDSGLRFTTHCRGGFFTLPEGPQRRAAIDDNRVAIEEAATLAAAGAEGSTAILVLVAGGLPEGSRDLIGARERVRDAIGELVPDAAAAGVTLAIEPLHPMYASDRAVVSTLGQALDIAADFDPAVVGTTVDTFHIWWDPDVLNQIARAGREGRIATYQVCDWKTPLAADVLLSRHYPGDGVIDFASLTGAVLDAGYRGDIEVEIFNEQIWADTPGERRPPHRRDLRLGDLAAAFRTRRLCLVSETTAERARASAPTLHDVARSAGVSLATASRVLNGSTRKVAEAYRERVEAAAAELGYTANLSAQATARGTSAIIALLVADIADPYFAQIAAGVARGADEAGLVVTIAITERDPQREARLVRALRGQRPRGLILAASRTAESSDPVVQAELDALASTGGRVVALGPGAGAVRSVIVDNTKGARDLGRALGERGYRNAIVLAAGEGVLTSDDRTAGFTEGFAAAGGSVSRVYRGGFTRESGLPAHDAGDQRRRRARHTRLRDQRRRRDRGDVGRARGGPRRSGPTSRCAASTTSPRVAMSPRA